MNCTQELLRASYTARTIYEALRPSDEGLVIHPRSTLYVRNCFFHRLDTIKDEPKVKLAPKTMLRLVEDLLKSQFNTDLVPMWATAVDFANLDLEKDGLEEWHIYMNVNMDSSMKYLITFGKQHAAVIRNTEHGNVLVRAPIGRPYKVKTLKKDLGL